MRKALLKGIQAIDQGFYAEVAKHGFLASMNAGDIEAEVLFENKCPICNFGIDLTNDWRHFHSIGDTNEFDIITLHVCPHCYHAFCIFHHMKYENRKLKEISQSVYPNNVENIEIKEEIREISPRFYEIYGQCKNAKNEGFTELYGMGFRKALECLVKDYASQKNPDKKDEIIAKSLHNCIIDYFGDFEGKEEMLACKWIGNNETHYLNENKSEDFNLFEGFIEDIIYYIHREIRKTAATQINQINQLR